MAQNLSVVVWSKEGCSYCNEVKKYLAEQNIPYKTVDVTNHDEFRDILETKYNVRHVPVVEIGEGNTYKAVTEVGLEHLKVALEPALV
ncbi:glutaredoxin family protein [Psychrobacillus sp. NEAU-3TGS]|uniref:glutaredoxin family protein n=1 Tax=Psychrobacillus sp. NEAU-3TGS TaxID=2995412 RepID=UPI0024961EEB|nr:glutaredoxin family protein [Psychrobacillus sp. NEAU-3TGS]MDI2589479.1 glutaredoxin family protein [Psychrobacillus sp. NEAU-3TGS]